MLMIDRVELVLFDQSLEVRKLKRDDALRRQHERHPGSEIIQVRDLSQHIVADD